MRAGSESPFFFGARSGLFGMYHAPEGQKRSALLMCPPLGQDLIRCHRLYRQLAQAVAARGFAVLRFDYHGTGDSAGDSADVQWDRCVADTVAAAAELRARSGVDRVIAFGARLGASVALSASEARFADVIAWDAVLDGQGYMASLDALQAALREDAGRFTRPRAHADVAAQWLGFAVGDPLRRQLAALRPEALRAPSLAIDSTATTPRTEGTTRILPLGQPTPWNDLRRLESAILSHPLIRAVGDYLEEAA
ncbi:MAG: hypothetical protein GAK28_00801 [Luteibacter sp.]|uniref:serine aminopeptidase domain-containing protein n=1 Tax=Luteibacter sp. TaxID=1886636 RepID=UPI00138440E3|nr:alpha/beta hydrolase [Luteibacter sp.]KAF1009168.1 MAG: hypothetical protein GAK28_00801 [Luteibacter sp.]